MSNRVQGSSRGPEPTRGDGEPSPGAPEPSPGGQPAGHEPQAAGGRPPDRYEPLPGVAGLPGWIWRKLPPAGRVALALVPVAIVALVVVLGPGIRESKDERARGEAERRAQLRAERTAEIRAAQRPRFDSGTPAGADLGLRTALVDSLPPAIAADARARVRAGDLRGPIREVTCEPYPRTVSGAGAHLDPAAATGRYSCLAVTRAAPETDFNEGSIIGHPYRVKVDFDTGRYAFCKVTGRAGEGAIGTQRFVPVPAICGGS